MIIDNRFTGKRIQAQAIFNNCLLDRFRWYDEEESRRMKVDMKQSTCKMAFSL